MKMKRTLAGVAAGLVAVSAMATAVSADQDHISLTYDLRTKVTTKEDAVVALTETWARSEGNFYDLELTYDSNGDGQMDGYTFGFAGSAAGLGDIQEATVRFNYTYKTMVPVVTTVVDDGETFLRTEWKEKDVTNTYEKTYKLADKMTDDDYLRNVLPVSIDERNGKKNAIDTYGDGVNNFVVFDNTNKKFYVPANTLDDSDVTTSYVLDLDANGDIIWEEKEYYETSALTVSDDAGTITATKYTVNAYNPDGSSAGVKTFYATKTSDTLNSLIIAASTATFNGRLLPADEAHGALNTSYVIDGTEVFLDVAGATNETVTLSVSTQPSASAKPVTVRVPKFHKVDTINRYGNENPVNSVREKDFPLVSDAFVSISYKVPGYYTGSDVNGWEWYGIHGTSYYSDAELARLGIPYNSEKAQDLAHIRSGLYSTQDSVEFGKNGTIGIGGLKAGEKKDHFYPLWTTTEVRKYYSTTSAFKDGKITDPINNGSTELYTNDVIAAIRRSGVGTSPLSVINDAIANDLDVKFTFTTTQYHVGTLSTNSVLQWANVGEGFDYDIKNSWYKTAFGQHLYSNKYSSVASPYSGASFTPAYTYNASDATSDMYGSYSSAWAQNLISAGLVVNSELTMQLNDTKKLVWNENQLTFNWFDVTDETKITRANQLLTTMLLYTPVDWFWDRLEVEVIEPEEEEDVNAGEGIEEEGDILDEEIEEEEVEEDFEEEEEEDWEEEEEEEEEEEIEEPEVVETEAEPEVVAPVASPKTGNSPIALAVIPVALAAAAVVAKKRG